MGDVQSTIMITLTTSQKRVKTAVETVLDGSLPDSYDRAIFTEKCNSVFDLMMNYASRGLKWTA